MKIPSGYAQLAGGWTGKIGAANTTSPTNPRRKLNVRGAVTSEGLAIEALRGDHGKCKRGFFTHPPTLLMITTIPPGGIGRSHLQGVFWRRRGLTGGDPGQGKPHSVGWGDAGGNRPPQRLHLAPRALAQRAGRSPPLPPGSGGPWGGRYKSLIRGGPYRSAGVSGSVAAGAANFDDVGRLRVERVRYPPTRSGDPEGSLATTVVIGDNLMPWRWATWKVNRLVLKS